MRGTSKEKIPWKLGLRCRLGSDNTFTGDFWVKYETVHSSTYDEDEQTIYFITTKSNGTPAFYFKQLLTNGSFPQEFNRLTSLLYDGLFDVNGVLFGLSHNNIINDSTFRWVQIESCRHNRNRCDHYLHSNCDFGRRFLSIKMLVKLNSKSNTV
jgi:hypothetical protein